MYVTRCSACIMSYIRENLYTYYNLRIVTEQFSIQKNLNSDKLNNLCTCINTTTFILVNQKITCRGTELQLHFAVIDSYKQKICIQRNE